MPSIDCSEAPNFGPACELPEVSKTEKLDATRDLYVIRILETVPEIGPLIDEPSRIPSLPDLDRRYRNDLTDFAIEQLKDDPTLTLADILDYENDLRVSKLAATIKLCSNLDFDQEGYQLEPAGKNYSGITGSHSSSTVDQAVSHYYHTHMLPRRADIRNYMGNGSQPPESLIIQQTKLRSWLGKLAQKK